MTKILRIGHRGAAGYEPENTLRSIAKALTLNVDMVEIDVHCCRSKEIVVIHDPKLDRTTNGKGQVSSRTLGELKQLDAGKGEKIPTLEEVLDLINRKAKVNIELKGKNTLKPVVRTIEHYVREKGWSYADFLVSSVYRFNLLRIRKLNPLIPLAALFKHPAPGLLSLAAKIEAYSINAHFLKITEKFVAKAHLKNLKVLAWTVNDPADIKRMKELGVDGIFSDYPDRI